MIKLDKYRKALLAVLIISVALLSGVAFARETSTSDQAVEDPFRTNWDARKSAAARPSASGVTGASYLDAILKLKLQKGINDLYPYSASLLIEAIEAGRAGQTQQVAELLARARDLAPDFAGVDFTESNLSLRRGQIINAVATFFHGARHKMSSFHGALPILFNVLSVLLTAFFWTIVLFAAMLIARYSKLVGHDLEERISGFSKREALGLAVAMILFPVVFVPNIGIYVFLSILMLWVYMSLRERIVAAVLVILLLLSFLPFRLLGQYLSVTSEPVFQSMVRVREGAWSEDDVRVLEEGRRSAPNRDRAADVVFSLATALMYSEKFEEAELLFRELGSSGMSFEATLMLGNLYYKWQKYDLALKQFEAAVSMAPDSFAAHYNLAMSLRRPELVSLHAEYVERADGEEERARQFDPPRQDALTRYQLLNPGLLVEDARLPLNRLYDNMMESTPSRLSAAQSIFAIKSGGIPLNAMPFISIGILICFGVLTWLSSRFKPASLCWRCGRVFCPLCQKSIGTGEVCVRCHYAFEQSTGMDPRARERVRAEARLYTHHSGRIAQIMSLVFPGSGHLLIGRTASGVIFSFISSLYWLGLLYHNGIIRSSWPNPSPAIILPILIATIVYIIYVAIVAWNAAVSE